MTKCPVDHSEMEKKGVDVVDTVILDVCPKCDGICLDHERLKRISGDETLEIKLYDRGGSSKICPTCDDFMHTIEYLRGGFQKDIKFDECGCGSFLDKGKLEKITGKPLVLKSVDGRPSLGVNVSQLEELVEKKRIVVDLYEVRLILEKKEEVVEETDKTEEEKGMEESLSKRIHNFFEKPKGKFSIGTQLFIVYLIIMSVALTFIELIFEEAVREYAWIIDPTNMFILAVFTVEYVLRVATAPRTFLFVKRPLNVIDLLAILPHIIEIMFQVTVGYQTMALRGLRLLRLFRLTRLLRALRLLRLTYKLMWIE